MFNFSDCVLSFIYIMETSTPFVSIRSILSTLGYKNTKLYIINGLLMIGTFFVFRICIVPYAFYWYSTYSNKSLLDVRYICRVSFILFYNNLIKSISTDFCIASYTLQNKYYSDSSSTTILVSTNDQRSDQSIRKINLRKCIIQVF